MKHINYIALFMALILLILSACTSSPENVIPLKETTEEEIIAAQETADETTEQETETTEENTTETELAVIPEIKEKCDESTTLIYYTCRVLEDVDNKIMLGVSNVGRYPIEGLWIEIYRDGEVAHTKHIAANLTASPDNPQVFYRDFDLMEEFGETIESISKFYIFPEDIEDGKLVYCKNKRLGFTPRNNCKTTIHLN